MRPWCTASANGVRTGRCLRCFWNGRCKLRWIRCTGTSGRCCVRSTWRRASSCGRARTRCGAGGRPVVAAAQKGQHRSRLMMTCFVERNDGAENRLAIIGYVQRHGSPLAVHTDHSGQWADDEEGADRHDHLTSAGRAGGRGDPGRLAPKRRGESSRRRRTAWSRRCGWRGSPPSTPRTGSWPSTGFRSGTSASRSSLWRP